MVGTFTQQALKASFGQTKWLDFFKYASVEFAKLENSPIDVRYEGVDTFKKLKECITILDINKRLSAFKVAVKTISSKSTKKGAGYYILFLDLEKRVIKLREFNKSQLEEATNLYNEEEQKYSNDKSKDLVLVSAGSLRDLRRAYPNYFSDTDNFSKYIKKVFMANE